MKIKFNSFNAAMECWNSIEQGGIVVEGPHYFRMKVVGPQQFAIITSNVSILKEEGLHCSNRLPQNKTTRA